MNARDDEGGPIRAPWTRAPLAALCTSVLVGALLASQGGIWEYVNGGDLHGMFVAWYEYSSQALFRDGRIPLWQSHQFFGTPALALTQNSVLYPPVLLLFGSLPPRIALQVYYALHVFLLAWGMTAYLGARGIGPVIAGVASLLALSAVFRGTMLTGVDHPSFIACVAWLPLMLLFWERAVRERKPRFVGLLALAVAAQWLAGYPDFTIDAAVMLGLVALISSDASVLRRVGTLAAGFALGTALAAVQLVPLAEAVSQSPRGVANFDLFRSAFVMKSSSHLAETLAYRFGAAGLLLALCALARPTRSRLAWAVAFVWSSLALNYPFALLYHAPIFSSLRFPFGWDASSGVFLGLLAATGLAELKSRSTRWSRPLAVGLGAAALAHGLWAVLGAPVSVPPFEPPGPRWLVKEPGELGGFARLAEGIEWQAPDYALIESRAPRLLSLAGTDARVLSEREAFAGAALRFGIRVPNGHEPSLAPRRVVELLDLVGLYDPLGMYRARSWPKLARRPEVGALLGIGTVVVPQDASHNLLEAGFEPAGSLPPGDLVLRRAPVPRARLVHRLARADGEYGTLAAVRQGASRALEVAVVAADARIDPLEVPPAGSTEQVRIVEDEPETVVVEASVAAPALLVLTDTYYPGWRVTVDGQEREILRADHAFRGVRLAAGRHRVVFEYAPNSLALGAAISLLALVVTGLCIRWPRGSRSRGPESTEAQPAQGA